MSRQSRRGPSEVYVREILEGAVTELEPVHESARLDAEVLLAFVLGKARHHPYAFPEQRLEPKLADRFRCLVARRVNGEPVAYLTGEREFWSLTFKVTRDTLIPRPETERLVEIALELTPTDQRLRIVDLGTGSGAIAIAIASERPRCEVVAIDNNEPALAVARENAERHALHNIDFRKGDWCGALDTGLVDLVLANPPYVRAGDPHLTRGDVRFEPQGALVGGEDGLSAIRMICQRAVTWLRPGGFLLLEHGADQRTEVGALLAANRYDSIRHHQDYAERDRVTQGRMTSSRPDSN